METETISEERSPVFSTLSLLHRLVLTSQARKDSGFTRTQLIIVYALAARGELNMSQIADFIGASKEQATRAVAPLVDAGMAERLIPENNRARVDIRLTEKGSGFMRSYFRTSEEHIRSRLRTALTPEEIAQLRNALDTAADLLMKVN